MIKQVCVCSRCGKEEIREAYEISANTVLLGPIAINHKSDSTLGVFHVYVPDYGTHLCRKCKESFDRFMKNENEYIVPTELLNEDILKALAIEGCPEEFNLPQIKSVCEKAELEECVECFKKSYKTKSG